MTLTRRLIVCLDVDRGRVVKGTQFVGLRDVGDPVELATRYEAEGADEIVFLDITATHEARGTTLELARRTAERLFIPLTIGGGIDSVEAMSAALRAGADKVGVNSAAVRRPTLITEGAERFGAQVAEVEVDDDTGEVQVLGVWAAHDVGRVVNPQQVEGQIEGAVVMAVGHALMEEYLQVDGQTTTPGFAKYILPTAVDIPQVTSVLITEPDPKTPLGVKGIGEPAITPTAAAIVNAIHDAVGVRMTRLPATPERVLEALAARRAALAAQLPSPEAAVSG